VELDVVEWRGQDASGRVGVVPIASGPALEKAAAGECSGCGEVPSDWRRRPWRAGAMPTARRPSVGEGERRNGFGHDSRIA
jgi:hypothetical protein